MGGVVSAFAWPGGPDVMIERHHALRPAPFGLEAEKPIPRADIEDRFVLSDQEVVAIQVHTEEFLAS